VNNLKFDNYEYDEISVQVWEDNYKGSSELTRKDTWDRAAKACAAVENTDVIKQVEEEFKKILYNDRFVPGGRILANLGLPGRDGTTMYNCFVHNPEDIKLKDADSIDGIYDLLKAQAKTLKSEGGYGINASFIRPAGTYIEGIGSRTPGVLKFMELWDKSSEIITQGSTKILGKKKSQEKNKIRKGAQMLIVEVWHPDVKDFIVAKQTPGRLTKFNVSVGITPGFMEA
jgi:ribonucleoside-diphosphate reductase alpha chain